MIIIECIQIHTHGLHISGETPGDNIFDAINGGEQMTYIYQIPCDHAGGLFWYDYTQSKTLNIYFSSIYKTGFIHIRTEQLQSKGEVEQLEQL